VQSNQLRLRRIADVQKTTSAPSHYFFTESFVFIDILALFPETRNNADLHVGADSTFCLLT
jgi:hypothetical protein